MMIILKIKKCLYYWGHSSFHNEEGGKLFKEDSKAIFDYKIWKDKEYEGGAMWQTVNVTNIGSYQMLSNPFNSCNRQNNCQDFIDRVDFNYNKIVNIYE